ncbi:hypothetical protein [Paenibacillus radicis (ex Xue et al. 2023)]|uniref:Uncharacterized protein n=1 Tax=Paenibacillus radicis (ex Xue et al. 2023) TaxID=2972489 RepID=A0ABT1YN40_9BACL|nr:hypothetical protein [Paenibacillus radicis (ex Xue et al. 2023)]MCR8634594.1 hypothetical protein [Paenibacillus radicis (ex Xue et al. 2023)]
MARVFFVNIRIFTINKARSWQQKQPHKSGLITRDTFQDDEHFDILDSDMFTD